MLTCDNVVRRFGSKLALAGVSLQMRPGVVGLLGSNGAGKTTLMHILAGLDAPTRGEVAWDGQPVAKHSDLRAKVGVCLAASPPATWLTGAEYLHMFARAFGLTDGQHRAATLLDAVGLTGAADRAVSTYSKGMTQRLKIAATVLHDPSAIILDEPFNGLDPAQRATVMTMLSERVAGGASVLVSSHMLGDLEGVCDEIVVMKGGHVVAQGRPSVLRAAISDVPQELAVTASDARQLAVHLMGAQAVAGVDVADNDRMVIRSTSTTTLIPLLTRVAADARIGLTRVEPLSGTIDDVYELLTNGRVSS